MRKGNKMYTGWEGRKLSLFADDTTISIENLKNQQKLLEQKNDCSKVVGHK